MKQAFTKYLLSLCVLLLSGYSHLYAQPKQEGSSFFPTQHSKGLVQAVSIGTVKHDLAAILTSSNSGLEKAQNRIYTVESEIEEDESTFFKKIIESSNYFTAILYAHVLALLLGSLTGILHFCKHFSYFSTHRLYLIFRVFRI